MIIEYDAPILTALTTALNDLATALILHSQCTYMVCIDHHRCSDGVRQDH